MLLPFKVVSSEIGAEDKKYNNIQMTKSCSKKNKQNNTFYLRLQMILAGKENYCFYSWFCIYLLVFKTACKHVWRVRTTQNDSLALCIYMFKPFNCNYSHQKGTEQRTKKGHFRESPWYNYHNRDNWRLLWPLKVLEQPNSRHITTH